MCFSQKMPEPKAAPPAPNPNDATVAGVNEQRRRTAGSMGRQQTILSRLSDQDVAGSARPKKLLGE